jgi:hypothetical protein
MGRWEPRALETATCVKFIALAGCNDLDRCHYPQVLGRSRSIITRNLNVVTKSIRAFNDPLLISCTMH